MPAGTARGRDALDLFAVSFLLLFLELTLIRWLPATVRVLAYFSNVVLVACFLGMGAGLIYRGRRNLLLTVSPVLLALVAAASALANRGVTHPYQSVEFIFGPSGRYSWLWVLPALFTLVALTFVGIGQRLAVLMDRFKPITGYSINIAGSLLGTVALAALAFLRVPPLAWFALCAAVLLWLSRERPGALAFSAAAATATLVLIGAAQSGFLWSPYYKISVQPLRQAPRSGWSVDVNDDSHQLILDLSPSAVATSPYLRAWQASYDFPYQLGPLRSPCRVLVLGAGTGNDVAAALRTTSCQIDAVELDPLIADLGRDLHPERPYRDPRVHLSVTDARAFLAGAKTRYDIIVLGWLDSHRLFSSISNVRQDNFVYTVEAMRRARSLLTADGRLVLSFYVGKDWVGDKIHAMLTRAFGHWPRVFAQTSGGYGLKGHIFVADAQPGPLRVPAGWVELPQGTGLRDASPPPTDRWPYLYYRARVLSWEYVASSAMLLAIAALLLAAVGRPSRLPGRDGLHFGLLGAAFLLLEVRNITSLALTFGSTWIVSSIVISAVLLMVLLANATVAAGLVGRRGSVVWLLLVAAVLASVAADRLGPAGGSIFAAGSLSTIAVSLSFFFAGLVFAAAFSRTPAPGAALGFNILGAVAGGLLEYASVMVGVDGLALIGAVLYVAAWATRPTGDTAAAHAGEGAATAAS